VHCGCRVIGHGVEGEGAIFCCSHCARMARPHEFDDRERRRSDAIGKSGARSETGFNG
jgi:hypothetical protein